MSPNGNSSQRTDIAKSVLEIARRVLDNVKAGRVYPQGTIEWAEQIVRSNPMPAEPARFAEEDQA